MKVEDIKKDLEAFKDTLPSEDQKKVVDTIVYFLEEFESGVFSRYPLPPTNKK